MLSIIVPTLNEEKYIGTLLTSLTRQSYKDFEVIVADAESNDSTRDIVRDYNSKLNIKLINSKRTFISVHRNLAAKHSHGDLLLFLDADIAFGSKFLEKMLMLVREKKLDIASVRYIPSEKKWPENFFFHIVNFTFSVLQYIKPLCFGACIFIKKRLFEDIDGFDESIRYAEDLDLIRRATFKKKFRILPLSIIFSVRRFKEEGSRKIISIWIKTFFYFLFTAKVPLHIQKSYSKA